MGVIETIKRYLVLFLRLWGFCYPSKVVVISDTTTGKDAMIEHFQITNATKRPYNKNQNHDDKDKEKEKGEPKDQGQDPKKPKQKANAKEEGDDSNNENEDYDDDEQYIESAEIPDNQKGFSMVTDLKTNADYRIAGKVETMFRGRKPVNVFPMTVLAVFLPILVVTEAWQIAMIYNITVDPVIEAILGTFFITLTIHNARYAYFSSAVQVLYATKKMSAGGSPIYIPNMIEYLNFKQSKVKDLRDDLMAMLNAEVRPLRNENAKLSATIESLYKMLDRAKAQGKREGLTFSNARLGGVGPWWVTVLVLLIGIALGWFISGGMAYVSAPTNSTVVTVGG